MKDQLHAGGGGDGLHYLRRSGNLLLLLLLLEQIDDLVGAGVGLERWRVDLVVELSLHTSSSALPNRTSIRGEEEEEEEEKSIEVGGTDLVLHGGVSLLRGDAMLAHHGGSDLHTQHG
jgi:hypothetical protein